MKIEMREKNKKKKYFLLLILLLPIIGYFVFIYNHEEDILEVNNNEAPIIDNKKEEIEEEEIVIEEPHYEEFFPVVEGQQAYVVTPKKFDGDKAILILYSHGSNTTVTQNMKDQFMKDLQSYGILFTKDNYIFAASNQHGVNWGNPESIQDTLNLKDWVNERYDIKEKVYLLGFSMGGLPTMNFATTYPDIIEKIALLAPTTKSSSWNQERANTLKDTNIKLWHGNKDVNVPYSYSVSFVNKMEEYGILIDFITLEGKGHFDIDTEYSEDILEFFES